MEQEPAQPPPVEVTPEPRYVGAHAGINVGLFALDLQVGHFYAYASAGAGVTLLTNNSFGAFTAGAGYSVPLGKPRKSGTWKLDLLVMTTEGWVTGGWPSGYGASGTRLPYLGLGLGLGFRWEAVSGFSVGFKLPLFGYAMSGPTSANSAAGVGLYYVSSAAALPVISLGYRF